jgi:hypothetical protein
MPLPSEPTNGWSKSKTTKTNTKNKHNRERKIMKNTTTIKAATPLLAAALVLISAPWAHAQRSKMTADQIILQAQERQQAVQKIAEDFSKNVTEIFDNYRQRKDEERQDRQRQREDEAEERRASRASEDNQPSSDNAGNP